MGIMLGVWIANNQILRRSSMGSRGKKVNVVGVWARVGGREECPKKWGLGPFIFGMGEYLFFFADEFKIRNKKGLKASFIVFRVRGHLMRLLAL